MTFVILIYFLIFGPEVGVVDSRVTSGLTSPTFPSNMDPIRQAEVIEFTVIDFWGKSWAIYRLLLFLA